jgi:aspartyl-tRNA(Asn)/glutamyl-tRNA(Gln) amidotransferase subunit C
VVAKAQGLMYENGYLFMHLTSTASIDVAYVAELARLELSQQEKELFQRQLNDVLGYVNQLTEIDLSALNTASAPILNHLREDCPQESLSRETVLNNAPAHSAELILMPKVVE